MKKTLAKKISPYLLLIPAFLVYTLIIIVPMFENLRISFTNWNGVSDVYKYIGFDNYNLILKDPMLYKSIWVTLKMTFFIVIFQQLCGISLAVILQNNTRLNVFLRSLFFIPNLLISVVIGLIFSYVFSMNFGFIGPFFDALGMHELAAIDWLGSTKYASGVVVFATVWQFSGLSMVLYIGSLMNIPKELIESATIDGASAWKRFKNITFPLIAPALTLNSLMTLIGCIRLFDIPYVLTGGGPAFATQTIAILLYNDTFHYRNAGRGAADAFVLLVIILVFAVIQTSYLRKREVNM